MKLERMEFSAITNNTDHILEDFLNEHFDFDDSILEEFEDLDALLDICDTNQTQQTLSTNVANIADRVNNHHIAEQKHNNCVKNLYALSYQTTVSPTDNNIATHPSNNEQQEHVSVDKAKMSNNYYKRGGIRRGRRLQKIPCDICQRHFNDSYNLRIHRMQHTDDYPFKCTQCDRGFRQRNKLQMHLIVHMAADVKPFVCEVCGKGFRFRNYLTLHNKRLHSAANACRCKDCPKIYNSGNARCRHVNDVHHHHKNDRSQQIVDDDGDAVMKINYRKCPVDGCAKIFKLNCHLKAHLQRHANQRDYQCEICLKAFFQSSQLRDHQLIHTDLRPFQCKICSASFQRKSNLNQHLKIHSAQKSYACDLCEKSFRQKSGLCSHRKKTHNKADSPIYSC